MKNSWITCFKGNPSHIINVGKIYIKKDSTKYKNKHEI